MDWRYDGRYETGENPPKFKRLIFAESLSTYAKSGPETDAVPCAIRRNYGIPRQAGLSAEELAQAREVWARLPRFDDLVRGRR